jgi:hypothetical protein
MAVRKQLALEQITQDTNYSDPRHLLRNLTEMLPQTRGFCTVSFARKQRWIEALSMLRDYAGPPREHDELDEVGERAFGWTFVGHSLRELAAEGFTFEFEDGKILKNQRNALTFRGLLQKIQDEISQIGGRCVMEVLFGQLEATWIPEFKRFVTMPHVAAHETPVPQIPYHLLLNLCLKVGIYKFSAMKVMLFDQEVAHICALARHYAVLFEVQIYNPLAWSLHIPHDLPNWLSDVVIHDELFNLRQFRPSDFLKIFEGLFAYYLNREQEEIHIKKKETRIKKKEIFIKKEEIFINKHGFSLRNVKQMIRFICKIIKAKSQHVSFVDVTLFFDQEKNGKNADANQTLQNMLSVYAHDVGSINKDYTDTLHEVGDFGGKPLVRHPDGSVELVSSTWCLRNFLIATENALVEAYLAPGGDWQKCYQDIKGKIGISFEALILKDLKSRKLEVKAGHYSSPTCSKKFQCDAIIETEENIILIECKDKVLTAESLQGSPISIIADATFSALAALAQSLRTARILRQQGFIDLYETSDFDNEQRVRLCWNQRTIIHVALTRDEYGRLHDSQVIKHLLDFALRSRVSLTKAGQTAPNASILKKRTEGITAAFKTIRYENGLISLPNTNQPTMFFFSLSQWLQILSSVENAADLDLQIGNLRTGMSGNGDFWNMIQGEFVGFFTPERN